MSSMKIEIDRLNLITHEHRQELNRLLFMGSQVSAVRSGLDGRILSRRNIGARIQAAYNNLLDTERRLVRLAAFVQQSTDQYAALEQGLVSRVHEVGRQFTMSKSFGEFNGEMLAQYILDDLYQDEAVRVLVEQAMQVGTGKRDEALASLTAIYNARNTIARAQAAYEAYRAFGNKGLMALAHAEAEKQRKILKEYGVNEIYYNQSVNIRHLFEGTSLQACAYDPSILSSRDGKPVLILMPKDNQYQYLLGLVVKGGGEASWAKSQLKAIHEMMTEIGRAQVAWFEYRAKGMATEMNNAHLYAQKLRLILINEYSLSSEMVDEGDFRNLWVGDGLAGKHHAQETPLPSANPTPARSGTDYISLVGDIISANEGDYGDVNPKDGSGKGSTPYSLSVGKLQWYAERAHDLLRKIVVSNPEQAKKILSGTTLYDEIMDDRSKFKSRPLVNKQEIAAISKLLLTEEGIRIQDETKAADVAGYIRAGEKLGITDLQALAYFADLYNQRPASAKEIVELAGGGAGLTLKRLHETALNHSVMGKYASRRNKAYEKSLKIEQNSKDHKSENGKTTPVSGGNSAGVVDNGKLVIPKDAWVKAVPKYSVQGPEGWQTAAYNQIINQFGVETESRYQPKNGLTYCNIFVWDVTSAMGREIPHWVIAATGEPVEHGSSRFNQLYREGKLQELNANMTFQWLAEHGSKYGWKQVTGEEAQSAANQGIPAVAVWKNPNAKASGHIAIVRPHDASMPAGQNGIYIAQAGGKNFEYNDIQAGFSASKLKDVVYYIAES